MCYELTKVNFLIILLILLQECLCDKIKLYQTDGRITHASETQVNISLLQCSLWFENDGNSLSFNYNKVTKLCELSNNYPEGSTISSTGWNVYAYIVNGGWSNWLSWGSCSVTCKDGTKTRSRSCSNPSPSNGGQTCQGPALENDACNERQSCFIASNYVLGTDVMTQSQAKAFCEGRTARLAVLESQEEIDFLQTQVTKFEHWIGMTCTSSVDCTWFDGSDVNSGFTAWAPNEPQGLSCVYIGFYVNKWDDGDCNNPFKALCEYA